MKATQIEARYFLQSIILRKRQSVYSTNPVDTKSSAKEGSNA
jgi:hypothetical protein